MTINYKTAVENIRNILKGYVNRSGLKCLVIGESGGIDSCLCTVLANPVCKELGIPLIARSITIETNKEDEITRARRVGNAFATDFKEMDLTNLYYQIRDEMIPPSEIKSIDHKIACGNLKARIRMIKLYALAGLNKGMVLSTDNYTEWLTGFWTIHGDQGDFGMIQNLWKTEVYKMSEYIANNEYAEDEDKRMSIIDCINAVPTDGLGISNSDLDQLGVDTYEEVDAMFQKYREFMSANEREEMNKHPLIKRWMATEFKRNNPYNIPRDEIVN